MNHESWIRGTGSRQVAGRSMLIVNEVGYEVRWDLRWRLKLCREEQFLMEVGIEFYVAGEL